MAHFGQACDALFRLAPATPSFATKQAAAHAEAQGNQYGRQFHMFIRPSDNSSTCHSCPCACVPSCSPSIRTAFRIRQAKKKPAPDFTSGTGYWCVTNETRKVGSANAEPICPCGHIEYL